MAHSLGLHLTPPKLGQGDARSDLLFLERCLTYRLLVALDSNSTYGLKSHPLTSDETMYCKSLRAVFQSLLHKAFLDTHGEKLNPHFLQAALLDNDTEVIGVISDFLSEDNVVQRQLVKFRSKQPSPSAFTEVCALEESFRRVCVKHLSRIYAIMSRYPPTTPGCDTLAQMASNYIALRLHTWMVVLHSMVTGLTECFHHPPLRPTSALKSALRVMDHYEAFGHHPYFLCGTAFIASALLHLKYFGRSPEATLDLPRRVITRLRQFEHTWPLSKHIQAPILQQASLLGLSLD
ncbi:hypothetical protein DSO57_1013834 [Entomophthora muscae]|uniref:Uncharacterized protein n=1 Tax=Entomophthora muscae TaxID=34485 RepID=A0ACC2SIS8_9FUNG|nr:hypothetical protein DSO57_1013834 [Entomophthora muscae]